MARVSVAMSVYNTKEEHLRQAIESILNQTFTDFEFLILNDGSTNNAEEVIKSYNDKRIKYFCQENKGLAFSRNKLYELTEGEYIAIFDSDDISLPNRLEKQVEFLDKNLDISIVGSLMEFFPQKRVIELPANVTYLRLLQANCIANPTVMFRKADFEKFELKYNTNFTCAEDYELWSRAIRYLKIENIQDILVKYRWEGQNVSVLKEKQQQQEAIKIKQNMLDFLTDDPNLQTEIRKVLFGKRDSLLTKIFSMRNEITPDTKRKIITICGLKFKIKV